VTCENGHFVGWPCTLFILFLAQTDSVSDRDDARREVASFGFSEIDLWPYRKRGQLPQSLALMNLFAPAFRKQFKKINAFWVGPHALRRLESGTRLTAAVRSPQEFDLTF
jgi:hypothetical protein